MSVLSGHPFTGTYVLQMCCDYPRAESMNGLESVLAAPRALNVTHSALGMAGLTVPRVTGRSSRLAPLIRITIGARRDLGSKKNNRPKRPTV